VRRQLCAFGKHLSHRAIASSIPAARAGIYFSIRKNKEEIPRAPASQGGKINKALKWHGE
jgi:hypothetical protein